MHHGRHWDGDDPFRPGIADWAVARQCLLGTNGGVPQRQGDQSGEARCHRCESTCEAALPSFVRVTNRKSTTTQDTTVAPGRKLRSQGWTDPDELEAVIDACQADVVGGEPGPGDPEMALAIVDRFQALVERDQVPPCAERADDPQAPLSRVERQPATNGLVLDHIVRFKRRGAVEAGGIHPDTIGEPPNGRVEGG